jgi:hypothetical protein
VLKGPGTHWTAWYKKDGLCYYFDSYGLPPPNEFEQYICCNLLRSTYVIQMMGDVICGHLCILLLYLLTVCRLSFHDALLFMINEC